MCHIAHNYVGHNYISYGTTGRRCRPALGLGHAYRCAGGPLSPPRQEAASMRAFWSGVHPVSCSRLCAIRMSATCIHVWAHGWKSTADQDLFEPRQETRNYWKDVPTLRTASRSARVQTRLVAPFLSAPAKSLDRERSDGVCRTTGVTQLFVCPHMSAHMSGHIGVALEKTTPNQRPRRSLSVPARPHPRNRLAVGDGNVEPVFLV